MLQWLKDHFIPSEANDHQPHFLRLKIVMGLLAMVFAIELLYLASSFVFLPTNDYFAAIFASVLVDETNSARKTESLGTLTVNQKLVEAAQMKADDMATRGYFSHVSPDGKNSWYWFKEVGYNYAAAGENLAVNFTDSKDVTNAWMHSPSHRSNIMGENYTEIGIATAHGTYKGRDAIFVAQMFGRPSLIARDISNSTTTVEKIGAKISATTPSVTIPEEKIQKETVSNEPKREDTVRGVPTTTIVAGAETTKLTEEAIPDALVAGTETKADIIPSPIPASKTASIAEILTSPRQTTNILYLILAALVIFALLLAVFIKVRIQHPHIIANGLIILVIVLALLLLNNALHISMGAI